LNSQLQGIPSWQQRPYPGNLSLLTPSQSVSGKAWEEEGTQKSNGGSLLLVLPIDRKSSMTQKCSKQSLQVRSVVRVERKRGRRVGKSGENNHIIEVKTLEGKTGESSRNFINCRGKESIEEGYGQKRSFVALHCEFPLR